MPQLNSEIIEEFKKITGKDIFLYFNNATVFFSGDYNTIVDYYSGNLDSISSIPFSNFELLDRQNKEIFEIFKEHSRQFNNLKWWLLIEQIEEIDNRLKTLRKINKWARSSLTNVAYDPSIQREYVLKQNQTLENIASNIVGSTNPNDDWVNIAVSNRIEEEDYTNDGGNNIKISFQRSNRNFTVNSVVDVISGKSIYGKDLYRKIQFDEDAEDLKVLNYDETILQAVNILSNLRKNDNPDNPNDGLQSTLVAGSNKAVFNFPIIVRQMSQTFAKDDTLKNFTINDIKIDQDNLFLTYSVQTRLDETIQDGEFL
jgi:hypothetical protein